MSDLLFNPEDTQHPIPTLLNLLFRSPGETIALHSTLRGPNLYFGNKTELYYESLNPRQPWQRIGPKKRKYSTLHELLDELLLQIPLTDILQAQQDLLQTITRVNRHSHAPSLYICFLLRYAQAHGLSYSALYSQLIAPIPLPNPNFLQLPQNSTTTCVLCAHWTRNTTLPNLSYLIKNSHTSTSFHFPVHVKIEQDLTSPTLGTLLLSPNHHADFTTAHLYNQLLPWLQEQLQQQTFQLSPSLPSSTLKIQIPT